MRTPDRGSIRVMTRSQLTERTQVVALRGQNFGRHIGWIEANVQGDAMIVVYVLLADSPDRWRCVVVPQLITGKRGFYSIDLRPREFNELRRPSKDEVYMLLREFAELVPPIPLTSDQ